jgi:hypothetical protein
MTGHGVAGAATLPVVRLIPLERVQRGQLSIIGEAVKLDGDLAIAGNDESRIGVRTTIAFACGAESRRPATIGLGSRLTYDQTMPGAGWHVGMALRLAAGRSHCDRASCVARLLRMAYSGAFSLTVASITSAWNR